MKSLVACALLSVGALGGITIHAARAGAAVTTTNAGYRVVDGAGTVRTYGTTRVGPSSVGRVRGMIVGIASTPTGRGYWLVASDGGVFAYGDARFFGSVAHVLLARPIVGIASTPTGRGYWLVASDGGVFGFGDARFFGSMVGTRLARPIVGIASTPTGRGYWLVASDGGVFAYGDARYRGTVGGARLRRPVVGLASTRTGRGYWLVASDGGVFAYGDARYYGSRAGGHLNAPIEGIASSPTGRGYWLVASDGGVFTFGDARFHGSAVPQAAPGVAVPRGANPYRSGSTGHDISWPQCGGPYPPKDHEVTVVGVNDGHMYSRNPCLASQAAWAGKTLTLYVNVDGLPNDQTSGIAGPRGTCSATDVLCRSYNYGYTSVAYDLAYTREVGITAQMWWLDVEVEPIWRNDPASNTQVIAGVLDGLRAHGFTVGIYSTNYQWGVITGGGYNPRTPVWVPGATTLEGAKQYCSPSYAFGGGTTWLTQWTTQFDHAYAC